MIRSSQLPAPTIASYTLSRSPVTFAADSRAIEAMLEASLERITSTGCPPTLARALRHAVLGGGHRFRPRLCYAVARATGTGPTTLTSLAATAIELIHCASLVHDDLPCFDDAPTRRGKPSVHRKYGEATAVLTGDALIFAAFDLLARGAEHDAARMGQLIGIVAAAAGAPRGITAGQAWEQEPSVDVSLYHDTKTAALFEASTMCGALSSGDVPERWRPLGTALGRAYQLADDIMDHSGTLEEMGKPTGRDAALNRPSAVLSLGLDATRRSLEHALARIKDAIPSSPGESELRAFLGDYLEAFRC